MNPWVGKKIGQKGMTLIELLVVIAIAGAVGAGTIISFSRSRIDVVQASNLISAQVRDVQARAVSGIEYNNTSRCGYGLTQIDATSFGIFVGPNSNPATGGVNCSLESKLYNGADIVIETVLLQDPNVEFKEILSGRYFYDIFFEPPTPKTYINDNGALDGLPATIVIGQKGYSCASEAWRCRAICVYPSGKVELPTTGITCPIN